MSWRKVKLIVEDIDGRYARTSFYGLDVTRDKLCQMIRKWQSLIEATCEVKTQDGYVLRVFVIGFTRRQAGQVAKTSYAQRSQIKKIRAKMVDILTKEAASNTLTNFVKTLLTESLGENIINACKFIYPLTNVLVRKVKMLKR
jgi:small subunit ribosomal protein S3Ae